MLSVLASLAYEGRREKLFKDNFFAALQILAKGHTSVNELKGSWAGAMGQTQFMPVSFLNYVLLFSMRINPCTGSEVLE